MRPDAEPGASPPASLAVLGRDIGPAAWPLAVVVGFLLMALRRPDALRHPQPFAEDGIVFLRDAYLHSWSSSVFRPAAGYLHVLLRVWAELTTLLPVRFLALSYTCFALSATAACYALVLRPALRWLIPSDGIRVLTFLVLVLLPGVREVLGTLTNVIWPVGVALVLLSLSDAPLTVGRRRVEVGAVAVLGLTGVTSMLVWPAFWLRGRREPDPHNALVAGVVTAAAVVQALLLVLSHDRSSTGFGGVGDMVMALSVRIWGTLAIGERLLTSALADRSAPAIVWVLAGVSLLISVVAFLASVPRFRLQFLITLALTCGASLWSLDGEIAFIARSTAAGRYFVIPLVMVVVLWAAGLPRLVATGWLLRGLAVVPAIALLAFAIGQDFVLPNEPHIDWDGTAACIASHRVCRVPSHLPEFSFDLPPIPGTR